MENTYLAIILDASGIERVISGAIVGVIITAGSFVYKASKAKISENKVIKNPNDIKSLEKLVELDIDKKNYVNAIHNLEKIYNLEKINYKANLLLGVLYHNMKEYSKSKLFLINLYENIEIPDYEYKNHFIDISTACYYLGHIYYIDGDYEKSKVLKNKSIELYKKIEKLNLY